MATTERPPIKIDGKRNPDYDRWYREQKKAASQGDEHPNQLPSGDPAGPADGDLAPAAVDGPGAVESVAGGEDEPSGEVRERAEGVEDFQSDAEPEQTTNDDPREPEVAPALEAPSEVLSLLVIREARNSKFVLCALDKKKVAVRLLKRGTGPKLVKKHIKVRLDRKQYLQVP